MIKTCKNCREKFETTNKRQQFCSHKCYYEWKKYHTIKNPHGYPEKPKEWYVIKHMLKIRKHVMELIKKRNTNK